MKTIDLRGPEGNVFAIFALAATWNKQLGRKVSLMDLVHDKYPNGDYTDVLNEFDKMFEHIDYEFVNDPRNPDSMEDDD